MVHAYLFSCGLVGGGTRVRSQGAYFWWFVRPPWKVSAFWVKIYGGDTFAGDYQRCLDGGTGCGGASTQNCSSKDGYDGNRLKRGSYWSREIINYGLRYLGGTGPPIGSVGIMIYDHMSGPRSVGSGMGILCTRYCFLNNIVMDVIVYVGVLTVPVGSGMVALDATSGVGPNISSKHPEMSKPPGSSMIFRNFANLINTPRIRMSM